MEVQLADRGYTAPSNDTLDVLRSVNKATLKCLSFFYPHKELFRMLLPPTLFADVFGAEDMVHSIGNDPEPDVEGVHPEKSVGFCAYCCPLLTRIG